MLNKEVYDAKRKVVINVPTRELWIKVVKKSGKKWSHKPIEWENWNFYKENSYLSIDDDYLHYCDKQWYLNKGYRTISAEEFLGEGFACSTNAETEPKKTTMETIKEFAKNLLLSKQEKKFRKHGLKDACGNYTEDYWQIVKDKMCQDNEDYVLEILNKKMAEETYE